MDAVMEAIWSKYTASIGEGDIERWVEVKTKWDPEKIFRMNKNIAPRVP